MIITSSEIRSWKACRKKWWFRYDQELVPQQTNKNLSYGSLIHEALHAYYTGQDPFAVLDESATWPHPDREFVLAQARVLLRGYLDNDPIRAKGYTVENSESEFCVKLCSPAGRHYERYQLAGKTDLIVRDAQGNVWLVDHKTSSVALNHSWLDVSDQMKYYCWAAWQLGFSPVGIIYNQIRKPCKKPHKDESPQDYSSRLAKDITERPEFYYQQESIILTQEQLISVQEELWELAHNISTPPIYRNPNNCRILGCAYRDLCVRDTNVLRSLNYRHERKHIELEEVLNGD